MKRILPVLIIVFVLGCGSNDRHNQSADTAMTKISDTAAQHQIPQTPVSADSAGARKELEKSSIDTVKRP
jgi:hypothetical protein